MMRIALLQHKMQTIHKLIAQEFEPNIFFLNSLEHLYYVSSITYKPIPTVE
jgi:hypothetical protein